MTITTSLPGQDFTLECCPPGLGFDVVVEFAYHCTYFHTWEPEDYHIETVWMEIEPTQSDRNSPLGKYAERWMDITKCLPPDVVTQILEAIAEAYPLREPTPDEIANEKADYLYEQSKDC